MDEKIAVSERFRTSAKALAEGMGLVITRMDERDQAEIEVRTLQAQFAAAKARLVVYERRFQMTREMMDPQSSFHLSMMTSEAEDNIETLRSQS